MPSPSPLSPSAAGYAHLHCKNATSDKIYNLSIEPAGALWNVIGEHGKAAGPYIKQTRNPTPVDYASAVALFQTVYDEKTKKGYAVVDEKLPASMAPAVTAPAAAKDDLLARLTKLLDPAKADKMPVLLEGLPGTSKTYNVRDFGKSPDFHRYIEAAGHGGMETYDFTGGMVPLGSGKSIWMDGPVTLAFRYAAKGEKVLLFIDEINRVPERERGLFLNALSPHDGCYRLRTGRPVNVNEKEGTASMEMILCPVANISIVAATNSGSNFVTVEAGDTAEQERWHIIHLKPKESTTQKIIESKLTQKGWPLTLARDLMDLQKGIQKVRDMNFCAKDLSLRLALRVLDLAETPTKGGLAEAAREMIPAMTGRTPEGDIIEEQASALETAIDRLAPRAGAVKI